ncbi:MAG TPA: PQQ-dependent sugar dehydrogenase [Verrucomicrobiae bacterium]
MGTTLIASAAPVTPTRGTIEKHLDSSIEVYGNYAPVKLPIDSGVPLWNPGAIRGNERGDIFVANYVGQVFQIEDTDGDGLEDSAVLFCEVSNDGLRYPTAIACDGDDLYVATAQEIRVYEDRDRDGKAEKSRTLVRFPFSKDTQDWTLGLCFGTDGFLYASLSTDSYNPEPAPDPAKWRGSILRISRDGKVVERFVTGVRFAPGLAFNSKGELFFSDNEGGGNPFEELNLAREGKFYGHNPGKFGVQESISPLLRLSTARGVCNITFSSATNMFGGGAELFVAFWGIGGVAGDGAIAKVTLNSDADLGLAPREVPFARIPKAYDLTFSPSGDLYVSSFGSSPANLTPSATPTGAIYRIIPAPWFTPSQRTPPVNKVVRGNALHGRALFQERGCAQCHSMDGATELLGPNLAHLGSLMDFNSALREITEPSHSIRSGFETHTFQMRDGEAYTGRIVSSDANMVEMMVGGNEKVRLERDKVSTHSRSPISLMPENLLTGMKGQDLNDLFAFMEVREQPEGVRWRYRIAGILMVIGVLGLTGIFLNKAVCSAD